MLLTWHSERELDDSGRTIAVTTEVEFDGELDEWSELCARSRAFAESSMARSIEKVCMAAGTQEAAR